jgi:hypothetical protein
MVLNLCFKTILCTQITHFDFQAALRRSEHEPDLANQVAF